MKTRKCGYNHCKHGGVINIDEELYEKDGAKYYHKDCIRERNDANLIRRLWSTRISRTVSYGLLNKVIYQIIDETGVSSDYILFALQRIIAKNLPLRYPFGLKYYMDDKDIKEAYKNRKQNREQRTKKREEIRKEQEQFKYNPIVEKGFSDILGGE